MYEHLTFSDQRVTETYAQDLFEVAIYFKRLFPLSLRQRNEPLGSSHANARDIRGFTLGGACTSTGSCIVGFVCSDGKGEVRQVMLHFSFQFFRFGLGTFFTAHE
jgi:hypothetical protein